MSASSPPAYLEIELCINLDHLSDFARGMPVSRALSARLEAGFARQFRCALRAFDELDILWAPHDHSSRYKRLNATAFTLLLHAIKCDR